MNTFLQIQDQVNSILQTVYDPEIPVNIQELGLIYEVRVDPDNLVHIRMTLTSPNCPAAQSLPDEIRQKVMTIADVKDLDLEITFDPPWDQSMMSESAKLELGFL